MIAVNLIPRARRLRQQAHQRLRVWGIGLGAYAVFVTLVGAALLVVTAPDMADQTTQVAHLTTSIRTADVSIEALQSRVDEARTQLEANRAIGNPPDWSLLLALLARITGPDVQIEECRLSGMASETATDSIVLGLSGMGETQRSVSQFVLALEEVALFDAVSLAGTERVTMRDGHAYRFRLVCELRRTKEQP